MDTQTPTGYTILGFLALQPRSGYEIREAAQRSVRLFWGISEGQLYPQLHHLHGSGLIEPLGDPTGPRSSQQWRVTDTGRQTLHEWLAAPSAPIQMRDENLVKLMFSDQLGPEATLALLEERRDQFALLVQRVEAVMPGAHRPVSDEEAGLRGPGLVHDFTRRYASTALDWCRKAIRHGLEA